MSAHSTFSVLLFCVLLYHLILPCLQIKGRQLASATINVSPGSETERNPPYCGGGLCSFLSRGSQAERVALDINLKESLIPFINKNEPESFSLAESYFVEHVWRSLVNMVVDDEQLISQSILRIIACFKYK